MRRLATCATLFIAVACAIPARGDDVSKIGLTVVEPAVGEKVTGGVEIRVRVKLSIPKGVDPPSRIDADFTRIRDGAHSGQYSATASDLTRRAEGEYECLMLVKTPTSRGDHVLDVVAHGKPYIKKTDPRVTLELVDGGEGVWTFSKPAEPEKRAKDGK